MSFINITKVQFVINNNCVVEVGQDGVAFIPHHEEIFSPTDSVQDLVAVCQSPNIIMDSPKIPKELRMFLESLLDRERQDALAAYFEEQESNKPPGMKA